FDDPEQLDRVTELVGKLDVRLRYRADAFDVDVFGFHPEAVGQRRQDADLVQRIVAVDVERGLGLGVALRLRVLEHRRKVRPLELHAGEDVIARAVDDAVKVGDTVADEAFAQGFDDRNAAANAGLVVEVRAVFPRGAKQLFTMRGEEGLVGGDHRLAELQGGEDHRAGDRGAANHLSYDIDLGIGDDALPVRGHAGLRNLVRTRLVEGFHSHLADVDPHADAGCHEAAVELEGVKYAAAHGPTADQSQIHLLHKTLRKPVWRVSILGTMLFKFADDTEAHLGTTTKAGSHANRNA